MSIPNALKMSKCVKFVSIGFYFGQDFVQKTICRSQVFRPHCQVIFPCCRDILMPCKLLDYLYWQLLCPIGNGRTSKVMYYAFLNAYFALEKPKVSIEVVNYLGSCIPVFILLTFLNSLEPLRRNKDIWVTLLAWACKSANN